jgi:hypothetical protein
MKQNKNNNSNSSEALDIYTTGLKPHVFNKKKFSAFSHAISDKKK